MNAANVIRIGFITSAIALSFFAAQAQTTATSQTVSKAPVVSNEQKENIEKIVREYLLSNPEVIRDAMRELDIREQKARMERAAKAMAGLKADIYDDPASPVVGNPKGDVTVVVFFDYNCGYCKKSLPELQGLIAKDPMLRVIYKEFPILGAQSQIAATAALAAKRQGQYAAFNHALFASDGAGDAMLKGVADRLKLNYAKLQQDMADPQLVAEIERNLKLAEALEINGTPAYIIGDQIIPGAIDIDSLTRLVIGERSKAAAIHQTDVAAPKK